MNTNPNNHSLFTMKTSQMRKAKRTPNSNRSRIESRNLYESIEPLYFITLFMGLSPYLYNFTQKSAYKYSKLAILYSVCMVIILHVVYFEQINVERDLFTDSITTLMDVVHIHYSNLLSIILILMASWQHKKFIIFMQQLEHIDHIFKQLGFTIDHKKTNFFVCVHLFVAFGISLFLETTNCSFTWKRTIPLTFPCWYYCYYSIFLSNIMETQFCILVGILGYRFSILNEHLFRLKPSTKTRNKQVDVHLKLKPNTLKTFQKCHADLSDSCRLLNSIFAFQLLIDTGYIFLQGTLSFVHVFQKVVKQLLDLDMLTTSVWGSYYILRLFVITKFCGNTIKEAKRTARILHNIDVNISDEDTNWSILLFSKQLMHNKLNFNGYGFFLIDMTLFFTVIAAVCLYIMILVQMDTENKQNNNTIINS